LAAGTSAPFGGDVISSTLAQGANMFRTFTERTFEPDSQIEQNRNAVLEAETLVFLGFAFHMLNLGLLFGSPQECAVSYSKQAFGTALGLSESVKDSIA
jgi:hypothetical protein